MTIGKNILKDTLIKKTAGRGSNTSNVSITSKIGRPSITAGTDTFNTIKMTFYIKKDLFERLKNFAFWDRHTLAEAFNKVLADGLKGKNTKNRNN